MVDLVNRFTWMNMQRKWIGMHCLYHLMEDEVMEGGRFEGFEGR